MMLAYNVHKEINCLKVIASGMLMLIHSFLVRKLNAYVYKLSS